MTLVVARRTNEEIRILSDFRITDPNATLRSGSFKGALKAIVLSKTTCVCYAGNAGRALLAIREVSATDTADCDELGGRLLKLHEEGNHDTAFIVAGIIPRSRLFRISDGKLEEDLPVAWIGDETAFKLYQETYHALPDQPFYQAIQEGARFEVASKMMDSLRAVAANPSCPSVDGPIIALTSHPAGALGFKYLDVIAGYDFQPVSNTTEETSLTRSRSAAEGGYNYSVLTPISPGVGAIGVHYFQGRFGALHYPLVSDNEILFRNCNVDEFIQQVEAKYGVRIGGMRWS